MGARPMTASVGGCKAVMAEAVLAAVTEKAVAALLSGVLALSNTERRTQDWYTLPPLSKQCTKWLKLASSERLSFESVLPTASLSWEASWSSECGWWVCYWDDPTQLLYNDDSESRQQVVLSLVNLNSKWLCWNIYVLILSVKLKARLKIVSSKYNEKINSLQQFATMLLLQQLFSSKPTLGKNICIEGKETVISWKSILYYCILSNKLG